MRKTALILAAGKGTRMKSDTPKVLHTICGREMASHVLEAVAESGMEDFYIVVGHGAEQVTEKLKSENRTFVKQEVPQGTGHAVMAAWEQLPDDGLVLVLCGDTPLITGATLKQLIDYHNNEKNIVTVLTAVFDNPYGYGRIVKNDDGAFAEIVEEKDADENVKKIKEINSGMYCFDAGFLKNNVMNIKNDNAAGEYYITDLIKMAVMQELRVGTFVIDDNDEIMGVNDRVQLAAAETVMRKRINEAHMRAGVTMINPESVYIDVNVEIGRDTIVYPGVILKGDTKIGEACLLGQNTRIEDSEIGNKVEIQTSTIIESQVGNGTKIGPYAYLRPNSKLGERVKIGDFVEVKNANISDGSKASHLAYIGDADVGKDVNIGCGVVFVNYDGINKHRTTVDDEAFIGSNSNLVAPVHVEKHGYIAAGTTVTKTVPEGSLFVGRPKERIIPEWGAKKFKVNKEKKNVK